MANRSSLQSFNENKNGKISKVREISDANYSVPILFKILVSVNTEIVPSLMFENAWALKGDAEKAKQKVKDFLERVHNELIYDEEELTELEHKFMKHLDVNSLDYFLLDPSEIIVMSHDNVKAEIKNFLKEIKNYEKMILDFFTKVKKESTGVYEMGIFVFTPNEISNFAVSKEVVLNGFTKFNSVLNSDSILTLAGFKLIESEQQRKKYNVHYGLLLRDIRTDSGVYSLDYIESPKRVKTNKSFKKEFKVKALDLLIRYDEVSAIFWEKRDLDKNIFCSFLSIYSLNEQYEIEKEYFNMDKELTLYWLIIFGFLKDERYSEVSENIEHFNWNRVLAFKEYFATEEYDDVSKVCQSQMRKWKLHKRREKDDKN